MFKSINEKDKIVLKSVEEFINDRRGNRPFASADEQLLCTQQARDYLYSTIVPNVPRIAACIMDSSMYDNDERVRALYTALYNHCLDPNFVSILMQHLARINNIDANNIVGALLVKIADRFMNIHMSLESNVIATTKKEKEVAKKDTKKKGKDTTETEEEVVVEEPKGPSKEDTMKQIAHVVSAARTLLSEMIGIVSVRCANLTDAEAMAVAASLAMNNDETIKELIESDLPITATIMNVYSDPINIIIAALKLQKANYTKLTDNQQIFINTLKTFVYEKLNSIDPSQCRQLLSAIYQSEKPDVSKYMIYIKDCGTQYPNLLIVAKTMLN